MRSKWSAREVESETAQLDLAIAEAESVAEALADRLGRGDMTLSRYDIAIRPLDERIAKLKAERAALGGPSPQRTPEQAVSTGSDDGTPPIRRRDESCSEWRCAADASSLLPLVGVHRCRTGRRHPPDKDRVGHGC